MEENYQVISIEMTAGQERGISNHRGEYSFLASTGVECVIEWEGKQKKLRQEDILMLRPGRQIKIHAVTSTPLRLFWLFIEEDLLRELSDGETDLVQCFERMPSDCVIVPAGCSTSMMAQHMCHRLIQEKKKNLYGHTVLCRGLLENLLILIIRTCIAVEQQNIPGKRGQFIVDDVLIYIREHLNERITLEDLENRFYVSHEHIARQFKKQTGKTVHQYIVERRLNRASILLRQGYAGARIWKECGFESYSYFFQAFRKHFQMSPRQYVEKCRREESVDWQKIGQDEE